MVSRSMETPPSASEMPIPGILFLSWIMKFDRKKAGTEVHEHIQDFLIPLISQLHDVACCVCSRGRNANVTPIIDVGGAIGCNKAVICEREDDIRDPQMCVTMSCLRILPDGVEVLFGVTAAAAAAVVVVSAVILSLRTLLCLLLPLILDSGDSFLLFRRLHGRRISSLCVGIERTSIL